MSFTSIRDNMYEIMLSSETPIGNIQRCIRELEPKAMWSSFDLEKRVLVVDASQSNTNDIKGTIIKMVGVEYIDEFKDTSLNNSE